MFCSLVRCCDGGAGRFSTKLSDGNARSLLGLPNFIYTPALIANVTYWKHVVRPGNRPVAGGKPSSCELRSFWRITPWFDGIEAKSLELLYLQVYLASERMGKIFKHGVGLLLNFLLLLLLQSLTESVRNSVRISMSSCSRCCDSVACRLVTKLTDGNVHSFLRWPGFINIKNGVNHCLLNQPF